METGGAACHLPRQSVNCKSGETTQQATVTGSQNSCIAPGSERRTAEIISEHRQPGKKIGDLLVTARLPHA